MARQFKNRNLGSWANGGAPAEGAAGCPACDDGDVASNFLAGINNATDDPITQYEVPTLSGSTIRADVAPGVWGRGSQRP